jgi:alkanesulfonate monooxygenase SsuD/methylene tetrahydromethanopterin reductase-like flavin-dependent oxidoreductase (luciferase family)
MQFGIFGGPSEEGPEAPGASYRRFTDLAIEAEQLGYYGVYVVEHHFGGRGQLSSSLTYLSHLAALTSRLRLGTAVIVLPWHNPALVAEQAATVDVLSGGRLDLGVGRGYQYPEFRGFQIPIEEAGDRADEAIEMIRTAWTTEGRFSHHGRFWHFEDILSEPRPAQSPHPPLWQGAGSPASIRRVARGGYRLFLDQIASFELTAERVAIYREEQAAAGQPSSAEEIAVTRGLLLVASDDEREAAVERGVRTVRRLAELAAAGADPAERSSRPFYSDPEAARQTTEESAILGTPTECIERLRHLQAGGVERVLFSNPRPKDLRLFAREVMPAFASTPAPA